MLLIYPWLENNKLLLWTSEFKEPCGDPEGCSTTNGLLIAKILWNNVKSYKTSAITRYGTTNR